jgi:hypothetical protein
MDASRIGQTLARYRITAAIGAGGMGEVYRATDTTLGREVAIKVLPANVARDAERLARFRREAHLLASLNHPNIAAIYGLEETDATVFLALELIEGEDLSGRLARGPVPMTEALEIARQIAEALEAAHDRGIRTICTLASEFMIGGSWNSQGVILFSLASQNSRPDNAVLFTVSAADGQPTPLTRLPQDGSEGGHYWPRFLPDGRRFLFTMFRQSMRQADLYVSSIDAPDERHHLLDNYSTASVVGDRLLYVTQGNTLMSQRLDLRRLRLEAETQAIVDGVQVWPVASRGLFSASDSGVIVYVPGRPANPYLQLTWMDRAGIVRRNLGEPARYGQLALSRDEKQVAVESKWASRRTIGTYGHSTSPAACPAG